MLVGNRQLLINHNVEAPDEASEQKYRHDDRQIMYLAVAGKISAMFVVGYRANEDIGRVIRAVADSGVSILIRTSDANITEELVSNFFGLHTNAVKILSAVAGEMYQNFRGEKRKKAPAAVLHDGSVKSLLFGVNAAVNMQQSARMPMLIQAAAGALGLAIAAILLFLSGFSQLGLIPLVIYQLVSAAVISGVSLARRKI